MNWLWVVLRVFLGWRCAKLMPINSPKSAPAISRTTSRTEGVRDLTNDWWNSSLAAKTAQASRTTPNKIDIFARRAGSLRSARQKRRARTAYSLRCAHLRIAKRIDRIVSGAMPGFNQSKIGTKNRDVCSADIRSVEPTKITPSQISNGSQYFRKRLILIVGRLYQAPK